MINSRKIDEQKYIKDRVEVSQCGCWLWTRATDNHGYGSVTRYYRRHKAHRLSYSAFVEEIPPGACVLHKCDTPACVNPDHLELGTKKENTRQMCERGRARGGAINPPKGEQHANSKLKEEDVLNIKRDERGHKIICEEYGVSRALISLIKSGKRWSYIEC